MHASCDTAALPVRSTDQTRGITANARELRYSHSAGTLADQTKANLPMHAGGIPPNSTSLSQLARNPYA